MTTRSPREVASELLAWADYGAPARPSDETLREAAAVIRAQEAEIEKLLDLMVGKDVQA